MDNTVQLWDAATGSWCSTLEGHFKYVKAVAFSLGGQLVASASWDKGTGSCRSPESSWQTRIILTRVHSLALLKPELIPSRTGFPSIHRWSMAGCVAMWPRQMIARTRQVSTLKPETLNKIYSPQRGALGLPLRWREDVYMYVAGTNHPPRSLHEPLSHSHFSGESVYCRSTTSNLNFDNSLDRSGTITSQNKRPVTKNTARLDIFHQLAKRCDSSGHIPECVRLRLSVRQQIHKTTHDSNRTRSYIEFFSLWNYIKFKSKRLLATRGQKNWASTINPKLQEVQGWGSRIGMAANSAKENENGILPARPR